MELGPRMQACDGCAPLPAYTPPTLGRPSCCAVLQVHVVAQSLGALVALKLAAAAPERLKSVTILGASARQAAVGRGCKRRATAGAHTVMPCKEQQRRSTATQAGSVCLWFHCRWGAAGGGHLPERLLQHAARGIAGALRAVAECALPAACSPAVPPFFSGALALLPRVSTCAGS